MRKSNRNPCTSWGTCPQTKPIDRSNTTAVSLKSVHVCVQWIYAFKLQLQLWINFVWWICKERPCFSTSKWCEPGRHYRLYWSNVTLFAQSCIGRVGLRFCLERDSNIIIFKTCICVLLLIFIWLRTTCSGCLPGGRSNVPWVCHRKVALSAFCTHQTRKCKNFISSTVFCRDSAYYLPLALFPRPWSRANTDCTWRAWLMSRNVRSMFSEVYCKRIWLRALACVSIHCQQASAIKFWLDITW